MSKVNFIKLAEQNGIEVQYTPAYTDKWTKEKFGWNCLCDAPAGHIFAATGLHCDASIQGDKVEWNRAIKELNALIDQGFDECDNPNCEYCEYCEYCE